MQRPVVKVIEDKKNFVLQKTRWQPLKVYHLVFIYML